MIIYLWTAEGPGRFRGVTDNDAGARRAAESCMDSGRAGRARVEIAQLVTGFAALTAHYRRTGTGWTAERRSGRVTWAPFTEHEV